MLFEIIFTSSGLIAGTVLYQKKSPKLPPGVNTLRRLKSNVVDLFLSNHRDQQLLSLSSEKERLARQKIEKKMDRKVHVALFSNGMAIIGTLVYAPLGLLSLPGIAFINKDIFNSAYHSVVKQRKANVDLLTFICNMLLLLGGHLFWCSFAGILFAVNRKILNTIRANTKSSLVDVFRQQSQTAWIVLDGIETEVPISTLTLESVIIIAAGEIIPVDGKVISGTAAIDQRILTGESQPAEKVDGDLVYASTIVLSGRIQIQPTHIAEHTMAAQIGDLLNRTSDHKTQQQLQVENFSNKTIVPTLIAGVATLPVLGPAGAFVVIQSHFEHRMTIVSSIGLLNYLNLATNQNILVKNGNIFEQLQHIDTIVFDKTGTLTEEIPEVNGLHLCAHYTDDIILTYAAAAEGKQSHPIAQAIRQAAQQRQLEPIKVDQAAYQVGLGISVTIHQQSVNLGSLRFIQDLELSLPASLQTAYDASCAAGNSMVFIAIDGELAAGIELQPKIRENTQAVMTRLREQGIQQTYIISGDQTAPTKRLAQTLGIDHYFAEVLPEQKAELIAELQQQGRSVCFVGDGINDCIAMKQADASISLGDASSVATDTAQVILLKNDLTQLCDLFDIATDYLSNTKLSYSLVALPSLVSAGGAFIWHFGLLQAMLLPQMGLVLGSLYTLYPLLKQNHATQSSDIARLPSVD